MRAKRNLSAIEHRDTRRLVIYFCILAAVTALRLFLSKDICLHYEPNTVHDDVLQFVKGLNYADGSWMGEYNNMTLIKGVIFPIVLGSAVKLGVNFVFLTQLIYVLASITALFATRPIHKFSFASLLMYAFLVFNPLTYSTSVVRTYRDAIYHSLALWSLALIIGFALRYKDKNPLPRCLYALFSGVMLCAAVNTREDSQWLYVFYAAAFVVCIGFTITEKTTQRKALKLCTAAALLVVGYFSVALPICMKNYETYGVFLQDEYTSGGYVEAYGAFTRPRSESGIVMSKDVREKLYELSPTFATLKEQLDGEGSPVQAWKLGEEYSWMFIWAVRDAAANEGYYCDAVTADAFWRRVADEVNAVCDAGLIEASARRSVGISPPIDLSLAPAVLKKTFTEAGYVISAQGLSCLPEFIEMDRDVMEAYESALHCKISYYYLSGGGEKIPSPDVITANMRTLSRLTSIYGYITEALMLLCPGLLVYAVLRLKRSAGKLGRTVRRQLWLYAAVSVGLWLVFLLRSAMIAYIAVTCYSITGGSGYLAASFAPLYLAIAVSLLSMFAFISQIRCAENAEEGRCADKADGTFEPTRGDTTAPEQ
ncbi:MAG: hypothetical protein VB092_02265 [Oscillospiraceae bacterium]|nr:hypothetical protein [Oscillospiraceae bacterium]